MIVHHLHTVYELRSQCEQDDRLLVTTRYGRYPHTDDGVEVRRIFHKLRSVAMENFNEHFKGIFDGHGQVCLRERKRSANVWNTLHRQALLACGNCGR